MTFEQWAESKKIVPKTPTEKMTYKLMQVAWDSSRLDLEKEKKECK